MPLKLPTIIGHRNAKAHAPRSNLESSHRHSNSHGLIGTNPKEASNDEQAAG